MLEDSMEFHSGDHYLWKKIKKYLGGSEVCSCRIKRDNWGTGIRCTEWFNLIQAGSIGLHFSSRSQISCHKWYVVFHYGYYQDLEEALLFIVSKQIRQVMGGFIRLRNANIVG
jgi:hypothetical protein